MSELASIEQHPLQPFLPEGARLLMLGSCPMHSEHATIPRPMRLYRMPSSSRAYPLALEKKAAQYAALFRGLGMM